MDKQETLEFIDKQTKLEERIIALVEENTAEFRPLDKGCVPAANT